MQHKDNKNIGFKAGNADKNFTEERLTSYTGLALVSKYIQAQGIGKLFDILFPTVKQNATKFSTMKDICLEIGTDKDHVHFLI